MTDPKPAEPIMQFFSYAHLPPHLQQVSRPFCELADKVLELPRNPERSVALRKLLEAKDAAVRALIAVALALLLMPAVAFAQAAPAAPSIGQHLLDLVLSPSGLGTGLGAIVTVVGLIFGANEVRRRRIALGVYHAFHVVEDAAAETEGTDAFDKVTAGLKALNEWMVAQGWRPLKPGEEVVAKLGFTALNGATKVSEKVAAAAVEAASPPAP